MSGPLPMEQILKTLCTLHSLKEVSAYTLCYTAQQPHSRDTFSNPKNFTLDKLIHQQEGILAYKVINGTFLLYDFLDHGDVASNPT